MVAAAARRANDGPAAGAQTRQQQGGLELRAGHGQGVIDRLQRVSPHDADRGCTRPGLNPGPHGAKRLGDAFHWALAQGFIAREFTGERLRGQQSSQQPHPGPGISQVQRSPGGLQPVQTDAPHAQVAVLRFEFHTQGTQRRHGREAIVSREKSPGGTGSLRECAQQRGAVRDRLVARHLNFAAHLLSRVHDECLPYGTHGISLHN